MRPVSGEVLGTSRYSVSASQRETALVSGLVSLLECSLIFARQFARIGTPDIGSLDGLIVRKISHGFCVVGPY